MSHLDIFLGSGGHECDSPQTEEGVFTYWKELRSLSHWPTTMKFVNWQHQHFKRKVFIFLKGKSYAPTLRVALQGKGSPDSNTLRGWWEGKILIS